MNVTLAVLSAPKPSAGDAIAGADASAASGPSDKAALLRGEPIPGLFAVGQNGLGGQILWGHGLHIAWALTSGRLVGKFLAENKSTH